MVAANQPLAPCRYKRVARNAARFRLLVAGLVTVALLASAASASALGGPVFVLPPSISGSAVQGATVTCFPGTWEPVPTGYSYSWERNGATTIGGTTNQYTLTPADVGQVITCTVVAQDPLGSSAPAPSVPPIVPVALPVAAVPIETSLPVIAGSAVQGQTVACSPGAWENNPTAYAYSWQRNGTSIAGQASGQYTLVAADVNQAITCTVIASNSAGSGPPAVSLPIIPAAASGSGGGGSGGSGSGSGGGGSGGGTGGGGSGSGSGSHGGTKAHAPTIKSFSIIPGRVIVLVKGKRQSTKGATFRYTLDENAGVLIALEQRQTGRLKGKTCAATTRRNAKAKHCTRWVTVKLLAVKSAKAGTSQLKYAGWIGKRLLGAGSYRAVVAGVNTAGWSRIRSTGFTVVHRSARVPARSRARAR
jgi:uncharacterized membrane protein YgcG